MRRSFLLLPALLCAVLALNGVAAAASMLATPSATTDCHTQDNDRCCDQCECVCHVPALTGADVAAPTAHAHSNGPKLRWTAHFPPLLPEPIRPPIA